MFTPERVVFSPSSPVGATVFRVDFRNRQLIRREPPGALPADPVAGPPDRGDAVRAMLVVFPFAIAAVGLALLLTYCERGVCAVFRGLRHLREVVGRWVAAPKDEVR
jgi:hypothetical protein